jgi:hypothetical protein
MKDTAAIHTSFWPACKKTKITKRCFVIWLFVYRRRLKGRNPDGKQDTSSLSYPRILVGGIMFATADNWAAMLLKHF